MSLDAAFSVRRPGWDLELALRVEAGEVVVLLGPNGAGKSTTVGALAGVERISDGHIEVGGRVLVDTRRSVLVEPHDRAVGVVFQDGRLFPHLSALDNVAFGMRVRGASRGEARRRAHDWLERLGVADRAAARPRQLSGGEAQRVAIARALAPDPALLLLDEPIGAVDASARTEVRTLLAEAVRWSSVGRGRPTLLITQDLVDAALLGDRVVVIEEGRLTQEGTIEDVTRNPRSDWAAQLVGVNLFRGRSDGTSVAIDERQRIVAPDPPHGDVFVAIHPNSVALYPDRPAGTPRNVWVGRVGELEPFGGRVRVTIEGELPLVAEVTPGAVAELGLETGREVWAAVKATEVVVYPV